MGNDIVWCIFRDRQNRRWLGDDLQVGLLDEKQNRILPPPDLVANTFQKIVGITQSAYSAFWFVNITGHVLHSNPVTKQFAEFAKIPDTARLFADSSQRIWFLSREGAPLAVVLADIDYFKKINDTLGHLAGDKILRDAAHRMAQNIRPSDFIGRYGAEEFLIVVSGLAEGDPSARLTQLHQAISQKPFLYLAESIHVTSSFGVAWISAETIDVEDMIHRADEALYDAKASGRNRVVFFAQPSQSDGNHASFQVEVKQAIDD